MDKLVFLMAVWELLSQQRTVTNSAFVTDCSLQNSIDIAQ